MCGGLGKGCGRTMCGGLGKPHAGRWLVSCHMMETPGGGVAFVCGLPDPGPCVVCGGAGLYLCDWPLEKVVEVDWRDLRHGDTWVTEINRIHGRIVQIEAVTTLGVQGAVRFWV